MRTPISTGQLREYLKDKRIILDCGHKYCNHNFSNTMVVLADGRAICHECYQQEPKSDK